jgi:hypothetical protein
VIKQIRFALLAMTSLLSGCADNCSIFSGSNSLGCNVVLVGGTILAAPFVLPAEAAKRAGREAEEREDYLKLKKGVENGDLESLKRCVLQCGNFLVFMDEKHQTRIDAERKLIAFDEPTLLQAHVEAMMVAYESLAWVKTADSGWRLNSKHVMRGWALAQRFWKSPHESSSYEYVPADLAQYVFVLYLQTLPTSQIQSALEGCVVQDNLPDIPDIRYSRGFNRSALCEQAYLTYIEIQNPTEQNPKVPSELAVRWRSESLALDRAPLR